MADTRCKDFNWNVGTDASWERAKLATLMDIRDELKQANRTAREQADSINAVRHFFHRLGERKLKRLIDEAFRKADLQRSRRLRWNKSRKAKRAAGKR